MSNMCSWLRAPFLRQRGSDNHRPCALSTFWRAWKTRFKGKLAHRRQNSFGKCNHCTRYKEILGK